MVNEEPTCSKKGVFTTKETCILLDICKDTLQKRRECGMITPIDPFHKPYKYTGAEIRRFWKFENRLIQ